MITTNPAPARPEVEDETTWSFAVFACTYVAPEGRDQGDPRQATGVR